MRKEKVERQTRTIDSDVGKSMSARPDVRFELKKIMGCVWLTICGSTGIIRWHRNRNQSTTKTHLYLNTTHPKTHTRMPETNACSLICKGQKNIAYILGLAFVSNVGADDKAGLTGIKPESHTHADTQNVYVEHYTNRGRNGGGVGVGRTSRPDRTNMINCLWPFNHK